MALPFLPGNNFTDPTVSPAKFASSEIMFIPLDCPDDMMHVAI